MTDALGCLLGTGTIVITWRFSLGLVMSLEFFLFTFCHSSWPFLGLFLSNFLFSPLIYHTHRYSRNSFHWNARLINFARFLL